MSELVWLRDLYTHCLLRRRWPRCFDGAPAGGLRVAPMVAIDVEADEKVHSNAFELSVLRLRTSRRRMLFSSLLLGALVFLMLVPDFALTSPTTTIPRKDLQKDATLPQSQPDQPEKNAELQSGAAAVVAAKEEFEKLQDDEVVVGKYFNQLHNLGRQLDQRVAKLAESLEKVMPLPHVKRGWRCLIPPPPPPL